MKDDKHMTVVKVSVPSMNAEVGINIHDNSPLEDVAQAFESIAETMRNLDLEKLDGEA